MDIDGVGCAGLVIGEEEVSVHNLARLHGHIQVYRATIANADIAIISIQHYIMQLVKATAQIHAIGILSTTAGPSLQSAANLDDEAVGIEVAIVVGLINIASCLQIQISGLQRACLQQDIFTAAQIGVGRSDIYIFIQRQSVSQISANGLAGDEIVF